MNSYQWAHMRRTTHWDIEFTCTHVEDFKTVIEQLETSFPRCKTRVFDDPFTNDPLLCRISRISHAGLVARALVKLLCSLGWEPFADTATQKSSGDVDTESFSLRKEQ